jgi:anti-sigma regulatory factor (Ser/Thr protein kinase)
MRATMPSTMEEIASHSRVALRLPADSSAPARARAAVSAIAHTLPAPIPQKLSLVVSELVTNALRHIQVPDPDPYLTIDVTPSPISLQSMTAESGSIAMRRTERPVPAAAGV